VTLFGVQSRAQSQDLCNKLIIKPLPVLSRKLVKLDPEPVYEDLNEDKPDTNKYLVYVYTGTEIEATGMDLEEVLFYVIPRTSKWEKKGRDTNCLSKNPADCMIWCLVDEPGKQESFRIVMDTTQTPHFVAREMRGEITLVKAEEEGFGALSYLQILCPDQVDAAFVARLQSALRDAGYKCGTDATEINRAISKALHKYQLDHDLMVGELDVETLSELGFRF
jgi:hypothetical protein